MARPTDEPKIVANLTKARNAVSAILDNASDSPPPTVPEDEDTLIACREDLENAIAGSQSHSETPQAIECCKDALRKLDMIEDSYTLEMVIGPIPTQNMRCLKDARAAIKKGLKKLNKR